MVEVITVLILLAIVSAIVAVTTPNLLFSIVSVGAVGFLLSIVFLFLAAPDLAIVQIAVEVLSLVILIGAAIGRDVEPAPGRGAFAGLAAAVTVVVAVGVFGVHVLAEFPEFGRSVMERFADAPSNTYLREGLESTGAPNIVTAVLLDFRAYDTLGEATVLFCAVLGAVSILRRRGRVKGGSGDEEDDVS